MAYFKYFPVIAYDVRGKKNQVQIDFITNILVRVRKKLDLTNLAFFDEYFLQDGDTPESLQNFRAVPGRTQKSTDREVFIFYIGGDLDQPPYW